jgi:hypothetical protein
LLAIILILKLEIYTSCPNYNSVVILLQSTVRVYFESPIERSVVGRPVLKTACGGDMDTLEAGTFFTEGRQNFNN